MALHKNVISHYTTNRNNGYRGGGSSVSSVDGLMIDLFGTADDIPGNAFERQQDPRTEGERAFCYAQLLLAVHSAEHPTNIYQRDLDRAWLLGASADMPVELVCDALGVSLDGLQRRLRRRWYGMDHRLPWYTPLPRMLRQITGLGGKQVSGKVMNGSGRCRK